MKLNRVPRSAWAKISVLVLSIAATLAALRWTELGTVLSQDSLISLFENFRASPWAPLALIGLFVVGSPLGIPASPLILAGGAAFGLYHGWFYNFVGTVLGAGSSFLLAKALGRDFMVHFVGENRLKKIEGILDRHGFWTIVRSRFIPIPFVITNFASAWVGLRFGTFIGATAVGLAPSMLVYTYFGKALYDVAGEHRQEVVWKLVVATILLLLLSLLGPMVAKKMRRSSDPGKQLGSE
jgi:uncharacterized membrane protein YdjX (TVP38/TMEM64 family)